MRPGIANAMYERRFEAAVVQRFAELSGDHNPIHVDALAARRLLAGGQIVHGMLLVSWGLQCLAMSRGRPLSLGSLRATFHHPVHIGTEVRLRIERTPSGDRFEIHHEGTRAVSAKVTYGAQPTVPELELPTPSLEEERPRELGADGIATAAGSLPLRDPRPGVDAILPGLSGALPSAHIAQLLAVSRLVGMECPGLHSLLTEVDLSFFPRPGGAALEYSVSEWDERFRRLEMAVASVGMEGCVSGFVRPAPRAQASCRTLKARFAPRFVGQRALVVGGSRGLGEVAAKLLGSGGAEVRLTFCSGREDAQEVVADIRSVGGSASSLRLDVQHAAAELPGVLADSWLPTHLYYFASPFAFEGVPGSFSTALRERYLETYVHGFRDVVRCLLGRVSRLTVFYPSTSAIDEKVPGMEEYASAKAAGEEICQALGDEVPGLRVMCVRLPRLATDQTQSLLAGEGDDPAPVLADILVQLHTTEQTIQ